MARQWRCRSRQKSNAVEESGPATWGRKRSTGRSAYRPMGKMHALAEAGAACVFFFSAGACALLVPSQDPCRRSGSPNICPTPAVDQEVQVHDSFVAPQQRMAKSGKCCPHACTLMMIRRFLQVDHTPSSMQYFAFPSSTMRSWKRYPRLPRHLCSTRPQCRLPPPARLSCRILAVPLATCTHFALGWRIRI